MFSFYDMTSNSIVELEKLLIFIGLQGNSVQKRENLVNLRLKKRFS